MYSFAAFFNAKIFHSQQMFYMHCTYDLASTYLMSARAFLSRSRRKLSMNPSRTPQTQGKRLSCKIREA